jgi:hypothetical protein
LFHQILKIIELVFDYFCCFKKEVKKKLEEFILETTKVIENEFNNFEYLMKQLQKEAINKEIFDPMEELINILMQSSNDLNLLNLNIVSNLEKRLNQIYKMLDNEKENLSDNLEALENNILANLKEIVNDSMNQVFSLSKPIENIMEQFLKEYLIISKTGLKNVWTINSRLYINEVINKLISSSNEALILISPHLDDFLKIEQFKELPPDLKIKIATSDPHTNSLVKSFKEIKNTEFRYLKNDKIIALKSDDSLIIICIIKSDAADMLDNIIGIGTNFKPLVGILSPIINTTWNAAEIDTIPRLKTQQGPLTDTYKEKIPGKISPAPPVKQKIKQELKQISSSTPEVSKKEKEVSEQKQPLKEPISPKPQMTGAYISQIQPKAGDQAAMMINTAFNMLISKLNDLNGEEFSKELQDVSDLILEKKGFSVTLHSVRSFINKYKEIIDPLTEIQKQEIFESIENWKQRLF